MSLPGLNDVWTYWLAVKKDEKKNNYQKNFVLTFDGRKNNNDKQTLDHWTGDYNRTCLNRHG